MRRATLVAVLVLGALAPGSASARASWYVTGYLGGSWFGGDTSYYVESVNQDDVNWFSTEAELGTGWLGGVALGLRSGAVKIELEGGYRSMAAGNLRLSSGNGTVQPGGKGAVSAATAMLNLYAGLPFSAEPLLIGYFGVGGGGAWLSFRDIPTSNYAMTKHLSSDKWVGALQLMLGIEWLSIPSLEDMARRGEAADGFWSVLLQYRLLLTDDAELGDSGGQAVRADGLVNHELQIGICYNFL